MKIIKKRKNCPVCNSTRLVFSKDSMSCKRCGYIFMTKERVNKEGKEKFKI
jgi:ribosomal protein S27AE